MNYKGLLLKSFDAELSASEKDALDKELQQSPELRQLKDEISSLRKEISGSGQMDFSPAFEAAVLRKVYKPGLSFRQLNTFTDSLSLSFRRIAFSAAILLILLIGYNLNMGNSYIMEDILGISNHSVAGAAYDPTIQLLWTSAK